MVLIVAAAGGIGAADGNRRWLARGTRTREQSQAPMHTRLSDGPDINSGAAVGAVERTIDVHNVKGFASAFDASQRLGRFISQ